MRRIASAVTILFGTGLLLFLFQNCGAQNYDLAQKATELSSSTPLIGSGVVVVVPTASPTPVPVGTSPSPVTGQSLTGSYCDASAAADSTFPGLKLQFAEGVGNSDLHAKDSFEAGQKLPNLFLYSATVDVPNQTIPTTGLRVKDKDVVGSNGQPLRTEFAVKTEGFLQLKAGQDAGLYQLGFVSTGKVQIELTTGIETATTIDDASESDETRFVCGSLFRMKPGDQFPIVIYQTHASGAEISRVLFLRRTEYVDLANQAYCGVPQDLFSGSENNLSLNNIIAGNKWERIQADNFTLAKDGENLVVNPGFESFPNPPATGNNFKVYAKEFLDLNVETVGWSTLTQMEVQRHPSSFKTATNSYYAELDANEKVDSFEQTVPTEDGSPYRVIYDYAAREGVSAASNVINVEWNGRPLDRILSKDTAWRTKQFVVSGGPNGGKLKFFEDKNDGQDHKKNDFYGGFLDNVMIKKINRPNKMVLCK